MKSDAIGKPLGIDLEQLRALATLRRGRGPGQKRRKTQLTVRYSPKVVTYFKATGKGWQGRTDEALKN